MRKSEIIILGLALLSFAAGVYFYPQMPGLMASHWNIDGQVNGFIHRFWGVFLMPLISLAMFLMFLLVPRLDPMKENLEKFRKYFDRFIILIMVFLFYIYLLTIFWNLGGKFDFSRFLSPAFALLFYYTGVLIEHAKRNWFVGIRTPWTLSSDIVWDKTHKIGAKLFKFSGIIALLGLVFPGPAFFFMLIPVIFAAIFTFFYSYFEWRRLKREKIID